MNISHQEKKIRIRISLFIFFLGFLLTLFIVSFLLEFLKFKSVEGYSWRSIRHLFSKDGAILFMVFTVLNGISVFTVAFIGTKSYKSDLVKITEEIYIPVKAGQNQFGSAEFYKDTDQVFSHVEIQQREEKLRELVEKGKVFKEQVPIFYTKIMNLRGGM